MTTLTDEQLLELREEALEERYNDYWSEESAMTDTDRIEVEVVNIYEDGEKIKTTQVTYVAVPEGDDPDDLDEWAQDELFELTGTGKCEGDAAYFLTIKQFDARPDLVGREFEWGT